MPSPSRTPEPQKLPLQALGELRGGYVPSAADRGRPTHGDLRALQAKDIGADGTIAWATLSEVTPVRDGQRYAVREGDVLLPLRSARVQAVVVRGVPPGVIATGQWALLTPAPEQVEAEYIAWYLNHPATRTRLAGLMSGGNLMFLPLSAVRDFEVEVPPLAIQQRIVRVAALNERIAELEQRLTYARQQLVDTLTMDALRRSPVSPSSSHLA